MNNKLTKLLIIPSLFMIVGCTPTEETPTTNNTEGYVIDNKLVAPTISLNGNTLSWNDNKFADYYAVYFDGVYKFVVKSTSCALEDRINGNFQVQVKAYDSYLRYEESNYSNTILYSVNRTELAAPGVLVDGDILKWADVPGATSYKVFLNGAWQHSWKITKTNSINKCKMTFTDSGSYKVNVVAYSDNLQYEKEKSSSIINYKISLDKIWSPREVITSWNNNGDFKIENNKLSVNTSGTSLVSTLSNNVIIDEEHTFLYLQFDSSKMPSNGDYSVKVNNYTVSALAVKNANIAENVIVYDLSHYIDLAISISIEFAQNVALKIEMIRLFTEDNNSLMSKWQFNQFKYDWIIKGNYEVHGEGFCLELIGSDISASITNHIKITTAKTKLTFMLRKFARVGVQDPDPLVGVSINGTLIKPIGSVNTYATATGDAYETYSYNLSSYLNQEVEIVVESIQGRHACFYSLELTSM